MSQSKPMDGDTTSSDYDWAELKICTYNVHMWKDARWDPNIDRVIDFVLQQKPHILCLQVVWSCLNQSHIVHIKLLIALRKPRDQRNF